MKHLLLIILLLGFALPTLLAQDNRPYFIQYKNGDKTLINLPSSSKIVENKDYIEIIPFTYKLRIQSHDIVKKGFVTSQYVTDSLTSKIVRVCCENDKVSLSNPQNQGYSIIFDNCFHQIECFPPDTQLIEFEPSKQKPSLYWISSKQALVGVNNQNK